MPVKPTPSAAPTPATASKSRLGRGLNSLIKVSLPSPPAPLPVPDAPEARQEALVLPDRPTPASAEIPIDHIVPNPHQPRRSFTEANLRELADSIKSNGIIQPLVLRKLPPAAVGNAKGSAEALRASPGAPAGGARTERYELIAGERRLRAAKLAGLTTVPAHLKDVDALTQAQMALVENIQREDLNPIDRAQGYKTLLSQLGLTQSELAVRLGEERSTIANFARLLDLPAAVQTLLKDGALSLGHGKLLAGIPDILEQQRLAQLVVDQHLSVRHLEKAIAEKLASGAAHPPAPNPASAKAGREAHYAELEKSISRTLGLRAQLKGAGSKGKGKLTLHYANLDQFDTLMTKLGITLD